MFAFIAAGWRLSLFALISCLYMVVIGYWSESMNTLSLVAISVPLAVLIGFGFGVWAFQSQAAKRIMPMLDILQTVPICLSSANLMLFGFGTVVGLIASILYSFPPMARNVIVGLGRVPAEVIESGLMSVLHIASCFGRFVFQVQKGSFFWVLIRRQWHRLVW